MSVRARSAGVLAATAFIAAVMLLLAWGLAASPGSLIAFWNASLGSADAFLSGTLVRMVPLAIVGVGLAIAFRAGVFNIGGEGQLLVGAVAATVVGLWWPVRGGWIGIVFALMAASIAGGAWAGIAALLRRRFGVLEVISTIMLNFVAQDLVSYLVRGPLQEHTHVYPQTESITTAARLPRMFGESRLHAGIFLALVAAAIAWWFLRSTAAGFRLRAAGASPDAAVVSGGIDVGGVTSRALIASGALAGLAGGIEVTGVTYALYENLSPGYGFSAIAVATLAGLDPLGVLATALLFAVLETGALGMQRDAGVPSTLAMVMEAVAMLVVLAAPRFTSWRALRAHAPVSAESA